MPARYLAVKCFNGDAFVCEYDFDIYRICYQKLGIDIEELTLRAERAIDHDVYHLETIEKEMIIKALAITKTQKQAAKLLGISERALCYKLKAFGIKQE